MNEVIKKSPSPNLNQNFYNFFKVLQICVCSEILQYIRSLIIFLFVSLSTSLKEKKRDENFSPESLEEKKKIFVCFFLQKAFHVLFL